MLDEIKPMSAEEILEDADKRSFDEMCGVSQREFLKSSLRSLLLEAERRMPDRYGDSDGDDEWKDIENGYNIALTDCKQVLHDMIEEINKV